MNNILIQDVREEEIREAVFSIKASSAPGSDGMNGLSFQQYWDVIGVEMSKEIRGFFQNGVFSAEWNFTQICLIPKSQILQRWWTCDLSACAL